MSLMCGGGGDGGGDAPIDPEVKAKSAQIEKATKAAEDDQSKIVKMLLLGAGESGKSTIFKQMKVINKDGYSEKERQGFQSIVWSNTIVSMSALLEAFTKPNFPDKPTDAGFTANEAKFEERKGEEKIDPEMGAVIKGLWTHPDVQKVFERRSEFQLNDSAEYYFTQIDRIADLKYLPNLPVDSCRLRSDAISDTSRHILLTRTHGLQPIQSCTTSTGRHATMSATPGTERTCWRHRHDRDPSECPIRRRTTHRSATKSTSISHSATR